MPAIRLMILLFATFSLFSCYETNVGCLDRDAVNFSVDVDEGCPDSQCCDYPALSIQVLPRWGEEPMQFDSSYTDGLGHAFLLDRFRLYTSEWLLDRPDGSSIVPQQLTNLSRALEGDTLDIELNTNLILIDHNSASASRREVGTFRDQFDATGAQAVLGLREPYRSVVPDSAPSSHPLARQVGSMNYNDGQGYLMAKLQYRLPGETDTLARSIDLYGSADIALEIEQDMVLSRGTDLTIQLLLDYERLTSEINLAGDSAAISEALFLVLPQVLTFDRLIVD